MMVLHDDKVPLRVDETGTIRVGKTRVLLDLVVQAFHQGDTPETIVASYDSLQLADAYAVIAYYLRHRDEVDEYLRQREVAAAELRRRIEASQPDRPELRAKLAAHRATLEQRDAAPVSG